MKDAALYIKWIAILCAVMGLFGVGVLIIGYKDLSIANGATILCLFVASAVLSLVAKRKRSH